MIPASFNSRNGSYNICFGHIKKRVCEYSLVVSVSVDPLKISSPALIDRMFDVVQGIWVLKRIQTSCAVFIMSNLCQILHYFGLIA